MEPVPAADGPASFLQLRECRLVDSRFGIDELERGVDARQTHGTLRVVALVENCRENRGERSPQARRPRRADCELEPALVENEARRHTALEVVARCRIAVSDVRLAEEVVQLRVEAGDPDARAHAE